MNHLNCGRKPWQKRNSVNVVDKLGEGLKSLSLPLLSIICLILGAFVILAMDLTPKCYQNLIKGSLGSVNAIGETLKLILLLQV